MAAFETGEDFFRASLRPDLVLLDVMLPGMDGMEILQKLQENADTRDVAVIMLTAVPPRWIRWQGWIRRG